jgi:hypothetical protein
MGYRHLTAIAALLLCAGLGVSTAQSPDGKNQPATKSDWELVEKLLVARNNYHKTLVELRHHYLNVGDLEKARWAEEELRQWHRVPQQAFILDLVVPPPKMPDPTNVPDANKMFTRAMTFKDKGWGTDYIDNQRRAELLLNEMLVQYPNSDKVSDAAYMLGDLYESKAYKQYRRAALFFERCFQWNPTTSRDARLRAARLYDRQTLDRTRAVAIYKEVLTHETDSARHAEATKRLTELTAQR